MPKKNQPGCPCCRKKGCREVIDVRGCGFLPGVLVSVFQRAGGDLIARGRADSRGQVTLDVGAAGTYWVTVTDLPPRWTPYAQALTFRCFATTIQLTPASGYHCTDCCAEPLPETLHLTPSFGGSTGTLRWTGTPTGWDSRGLSGTGFTFSTGCSLGIWISGRLCQQLTPRTRVCSPLNLTFATFPQNSIPCSFAAGTIYTLTE